MNKLLKGAGAALLLATAMTATPASAAIIAYDLSWTGSAGYTMTGAFTFDSSAGTEVRDAEVLSLSIDVLLNGVSQASWALTNAADPLFNFNFDAVTGQFLLGGNSFGDNGQRWNATCVEAGYAGFGSGDAGQATCIGQNGGLGFGFTTAFNLTATPATPAVPEPASWAMMIGGLAVAGGMLRRRRASVAFA